MAAEYIVKREGDEVGKRMGRTRMLFRVADFLIDEKVARHRERPNPYGRFRKDELSFFRKRSREAQVGDLFFVQRETDRRVLSVHKVKKEVAQLPDLGTHPEIEDIHYFVWDKFGENNVRSGGRYYCRFIDGMPGTVSRHGYRTAQWNGAAEDIFGVGSFNTMAKLYLIADAIVAEAKAGRLKPRTVIVGDKVWTPSNGWAPYFGTFHTHIHVDVEGGSPCSP